MLADPQVITVNAVAKSCARIKSDGLRSTYATSDDIFNFQVSHQPAKGRTRRMVRIDQKVIAADPLSSVNEYKTLGVYLVVDQPTFGFTAAEIGYVVDALKAWLTSTNIGYILGSQS